MLTTEQLDQELAAQRAKEAELIRRIDETLAHLKRNLPHADAQTILEECHAEIKRSLELFFDPKA